MNLYELNYLITPKLTTEEVEKFCNEIIEMLKETDAVLSKIENPKKRKLAYKIKNAEEAYLVSADLEIDPEKVKLIEEKLKRKEKILRHIIISKEASEDDEEEKSMSKKREDSEPKREEDDEEEKAKKEDEKVKLNEIDKKIDEII